MTLIDMFMYFVNTILSFEIFGFPLYDYLITAAIIQLAVTIIKNMTLARGEK